MVGATKHAPKPPYVPASATRREAPLDDASDTLSMTRVEGRLKAKNVKKIAVIVEEHPEETLSILRGWLHNGH